MLVLDNVESLSFCSVFSDCFVVSYLCFLAYCLPLSLFPHRPLPPLSGSVGRASQHPASEGVSPDPRARDLAFLPTASPSYNQFRPRRWVSISFWIFSIYIACLPLLDDTTRARSEVYDSTPQPLSWGNTSPQLRA